ncbi:MBL fold metallo-hydrolase [Kutzneria chonburiensis]|uniref:MBL fold metallo-hydrolase n=1 Tax=Kutzneria chonburiensis TaxID=1483604 RepID=A0ABV6N8J0_9PSEU|nr:MBL fold metallo-hydrolase [Kutzneria chonburiensis]
MTIQSIADGVWQVATAHDTNAFLVEEDDGVTLVDVGWAAAPPTIISALAEIGRPLSDVRRILITHAHPDHVRGLAGLLRLVPAPVFIHPADAPWLRAGRVPVDGRSGFLGNVLDALPLLHWTPVAPAGLLVHDELVGGLRVIHTPGHSPGHVAFLHEPTRTLLTGDAVFHRGRLAAGPPALAADPSLRDQSLHRLPLDVAAVGFAHGSPLTGDDVGAYRDWLEA